MFERIGRFAVAVLILQALVALALLIVPLFLHDSWSVRVPMELVGVLAAGVWWRNVQTFRRANHR
ncbi:hypothetical protein [Rugosimonospora africana]|uniref:hypothetical protein n=1 Tax=Rugosimonospora africana TaxID=556532 RepID=UPI001943EB37|nr:hypothetical protein [Rugosimonospora africana]